MQCIYNFWLYPEAKTSAPREYEIYNFGEGHPILYHYAISFSQIYMVVQKKIFENGHFLVL
jgi:hypothetical protein